MVLGKTEIGLEKMVLERINNYLVPRKSSEVFDGNNKMPITITLEVRIRAVDILNSHNVKVPEDILTRFRNGEKVDLKNLDEITQWNIYWAQEMAAAQTVIPSRGGGYGDLLPARLMHYDGSAKNIADLFNNSGKGIVGKKVLETGSGSGLGLILLSMKGADAYGIDTSVVGIAFSQYLAGHFSKRFPTSKININVGQGDYFHTKFEDGSFDVVYNAGVAEHLYREGLDNLMAEMIRVTKPGGYVLIAVPNEGGAFYKRYKATKDELKKQFPTLVSMPADTRRNHHDIKDYMARHGLVVIKEDGLQVAPSTPVKQRDINEEHLHIFNMYLPKSTPSDVESKIAIWRGLEAMVDPAFRMKYGWTLYYVGQKPAEPKPTA